MPTSLHTLAPKTPLSQFTSIVGRSITDPRVISKCALALGGMVAVGTGSIALLSTVAGIRGYLASKGLKDQIQSARREVTSTGSLSRARVLGVSLATCALVWAILMMPDASYAGELLMPTTSWGILTQGPSEIFPTGNNPYSWVVSSQPFEQVSIGDTSKLTQSLLPSIADITADILADHPGQSWISLEQMVRRIDGLEIGVGLDNTNALIGKPLHETVYSENGPIYTLLRARGYDLSGGVDSVCRKLSVADIESIAGEYRESLSSKTIFENHAISPVLENPVSSQVSEVDPGISVPINIPPNVQENTQNTLNSILLWGLGIAVVGGALIYNQRRKVGQSKRSKTRSSESEYLQKISSSDTAPAKQDPEMLLVESTNLPPSIEKVPTNDSAHTVEQSSHISVANAIHSNETNKNNTRFEEVAPVIIPTNSLVPTEFALTPKLTEVMNQANAHYTNLFWWTESQDETVSTPDSITTVHKGSTLGGSFTAYTKYTNEGVQMTIVWYDHDAARQHVQSPINSTDWLLNTQNPQIALKSTLNNLYLEMLLKREWIKQDDHLSLQTVAIPRGHLEQIYHHLDDAKILSEWLEVLGFWVASAYEIEDSILPLTALTLPRIDELLLTPTSCRFATHASNYKYNFAGPNGFIQTFFPPKEAEFLINYRLTTQRNTGDIPFSGAAMAHNWHKHPDGILSPSGGDISEAVQDINAQYSSRKSYLYTIAVKANTPSSEELPSVLRLTRNEYGGVNSYELRSYIMEYPHEWARPRMRRLAIALAP